MARLISDGGTMTVGRRTANYTWGQFQVTLQEGLEQAKDLSDRMADGYIYRPDDVGRGRAELTFVRADARVDMNAERSDLESTLDGASRRTDGDVFYSREISGRGLGRTRPGRDYDVGDVVEVLVWGRVLELPVTAISLGAEPSDVRVQVGGQMLRDAEASRKRNSAIDVQIAAEKRQRLKEAGQLRAAAESAQVTADTARGEVADVRGVLGGEAATDTDLVGQLAQINEQLQTLGLESQQSLMLAVVALETELWRQQQQINEQNKAINDEQEAKLNELREALWQADQQRVDVITLTRREMEWQSELVEVGADTMGVQVRAHTNRRVHAIATLSDGTAITHIADTLPTRGGQPSFRVPWPTGAGTDSAVLALTVRPVPGEAKNVTLSIGAQILQSRDWVQVAQITVPEGARSITAALRVAFTDSGRNDTLGVRVRKGATVILQRTQTSTGGISGGGKDTLFTGGAISAQPGDVLIFEAKNASSYSYRRDVGGGMARLDYIV